MSNRPRTVREALDNALSTSPDAWRPIQDWSFPDTKEGTIDKLHVYMRDLLEPEFTILYCSDDAAVRAAAQKLWNRLFPVEE